MEDKRITIEDVETGDLHELAKDVIDSRVTQYLQEILQDLDPHMVIPGLREESWRKCKDYIKQLVVHLEDMP